MSQCQSYQGPRLPRLILCFSPERIPGVSMMLMLSSTGLGSWAHTNLHGVGGNARGAADFSCLSHTLVSAAGQPSLPWGRSSEAWRLSVQTPRLQTRLSPSSGSRTCPLRKLRG